jgi:hypothetical protein
VHILLFLLLLFYILLFLIGIHAGQTFIAAKYVPGYGPTMVTYTAGGLAGSNCNMAGIPIQNTSTMQLIHPSMLSASGNPLSAAAGGFLLASTQLAPIGSVLLVSNLNETEFMET